MPRDRQVTKVDIWGEDDYLDLTPMAQHLHYVLSTSPKLSYCGSGEWKPAHIAKRARTWTAEQVVDAAVELSAALVLLIDTETEEFLLRSWIKHDGLYRIQNMAVSMANARADLASRELRGVVVHEVLKLHAAEPELKSWERDQVANLLTQRAVDPVTIESLSPRVSTSVSPSVRGWVSPSDSPKPTSEASPRATPSPSPTPNSNSQNQESAPRKRGCRIPEGWKPSTELVEEMRQECPLVDQQAEYRKFVDYWTAKSGANAVKNNWDSTWRNWIRRANETRPADRNASTTDARIAAAQAYKDQPNNLLHLRGLEA